MTEKIIRRLRIEKVEYIESCSECEYSTMSPDFHMHVKCMLVKVPDKRGKPVRGSDDKNYYPIPKWCPIAKQQGFVSE